MNYETKETLCYRVDDLCGLLGVSRPTAYELVHREDFPKVKVGRRLLIPRAGLEQWLAKQIGIDGGGAA